MSDSTVPITAGTGTPIDVSSVTTGSGTVNRQRVVIGDDVGADGFAGVSGGALQVFVPDVTAAISITANGQTNQIAMTGRTACAVILTGTWTGTIQFEGSLDGTNWVTLDAYSESTESWVTGGVTANGSWWVEPLGAFNAIRVHATAWTSGTATGQLLASVGTMHTPEYAGGGFGSQTAPPNAVFIGGTDGAHFQGVSTNTSGQLKVALTPQTSGGLTPAYFNVASQTATSIKSSAGQLYGYHFFNTGASTVYVQLFNLATGSVTNTTTPLLALGVPSSGGAVANFEQGIAFSTAITFTVTTLPGAAGAPPSSVHCNFVFN